MQRLRLLFAFWLTIAATGAWADDNEAVTMPEQVADSIPNQVKMSDGTMVTARRLPKRAPDEDYTYTYKGVKYTYITGKNYTRFFDTNVHAPWDNTYGYRFDDDSWLRYDGSDGAPYVVAATIDESSIPDNGEVFILNDLVGYFKSHTHLACVADQGFSGESKVKRIYFQDSDAWSYNSNTDFMFFIGHRAFNNAPQLEKIDLMQYTTKGTNHWEPMPTNCIPRIWSNMLEGSPNAMIRVATSTLNDYRSSSMWSELRSRIISYEPSGYEINEYGVRYKCMLAQDGKTYLTNDGKQREEVMKQLRLWNADYQNFNAGTLLAAADNGATVYYTTAEGCDADYLKKNNGVARVYNDIGSYYNYKNIALRRNAFLNCDDLKAIEFYQTNGRSENSYSNLKICIENGTFKGCKNLKEIRMYYRVQDGDDHWQTLGPEDVIPGNNIFGYPTYDEIAATSADNYPTTPRVTPDDVRIIVSPSRYYEFLDDPNWSQYADCIVAADYEPTSWSAMNVDGLTYDYASKTVNSASTNNVVTQELSWLNIPIKAIEIYMLYSSIANFSKSISAYKATIKEQTAELSNLQQMIEFDKLMIVQAKADKAEALSWASQILKDPEPIVTQMLAKKGPNEVFQRALSFKQLYEWGIIDAPSGAAEWLPGAKAILLADKSKIAYVADMFKASAQNFLQQPLKGLKDNIAKYKAVVSAIANTTRAINETVAARVVGSMWMSGYGVSALMSLGDDVSPESYQLGLADKIRANMNAYSYENTMVYVPDKKLIYHVYVDKPQDSDKTDYTIYNDIGSVYNYRTVAIKKDAFRNNKKLRTINFAESYATAADAYVPMEITIPDSAFAGCTGLERFELVYKTRLGGERGLGPENFILGGTNIFAGCDSTKLKIIIDKERKQDFLESELWSKYRRFFEYRNMEERTEYTDFGVRYAFAYDQNTVQKVTQVNGHKIEHLSAIGADNDWLSSHKGQLGLFNDIGIYNNYKLDYVKKEAFRGNQNLKNVSCWDLKGWLWGGDTYYDFGVVLQDSAFADCKNLESFDLLYLCTDGINKAKELQPSQIQLGSGVFDNTPNMKLKMTQQQQRWFEADEAWAAYKDKFAPCLVKPIDEGVKKALSGLRYTTAVGSPSEWDDIIDMSRIKEIDFSFYENFNRNEKIRQFPEFKQFEWGGLDFVGNAWFVACSNLTAIEFPSTIKSIGSYSFQNCDLREIEIPAAVTSIGERAFNNNYNLKSVRCLGTTPAEIGSKVFEVNLWPSEVVTDGFKIYVPAEAVAAYKEKWSDYKDYIVAASDAQTFPKHVTTTKVGELAEKLGLETVMDGNYLEGLKGAYWNIDSLTVSGPLNGVDVGVLRFLAGADVNNSDPTYGRLRYLNLYNARLKKDKDHPYQCDGFNDYLENDDEVGEYMFYNCKQLETVILPKAATRLRKYALCNAANLKHLAVGDKTVEYNDHITKNVMAIDELVFLTEQKADNNTSTFFEWSTDYESWGVPINAVYTPTSLVKEYAGETAIIKYASSISSPFEDDTVMRCFVDKGHYFPSSIAKMTNIDGILSSEVRTFNELLNFTEMTDLGSAFEGCRNLQSVSLPASLTNIGYSAFKGCTGMQSIYVSADSAATLESGAFRDLPANFRIYVPKALTSHYRTEWAEYASHIIADERRVDDIIEVTLTEPNTLAQALGLTVDYGAVLLDDDDDPDHEWRGQMIMDIRGEYSHINKLKVNGPISGADLSVIKFLGGRIPWNNVKNMLGRLEYVDLYNTELKVSNWRSAMNSGGITWVREENSLPDESLSDMPSIRTIILPRTCERVYRTAVGGNEALEVLVVGDDTKEFEWDAVGADVSLLRMYMLCNQKPDVSKLVTFASYHPTLETIFVRPSLYNDYISDPAFTGNSTKIANNISKGVFKDDETFLAFAAHGAATDDDIAGINSVDGWFKNHTGITDLSMLRMSSVDTLRAGDMKALTQLQKIALPLTLKEIESGSFSGATDLHWADFLLCDSAMTDKLRNNKLLRDAGFSKNTICYMPSHYGQTDEVNVVVGDTTGVMTCTNFMLVDGHDYDVLYSFKAQKVENNRTLSKSAVPYTICLPYDLDIPTGAKAYKMSGRSDNELIFTQTLDRLETLQPYLIWADQGDATLGTSGDISIPASGGMTYGRQHDAPGFSMRGTLYGISNAEASELGAYTLQNDGKWHPVLSDNDEHRAARILPYRVYLLENRKAGARALGMSLEDTNGIEQLRTIESDGTERIYDLNGRQLSAPKKGINVMNGKKIITK